VGERERWAEEVRYLRKQIDTKDIRIQTLEEGLHSALTIALHQSLDQDDLDELKRLRALAGEETDE
jgi:hypothetical protein